MWRKPDLAIIPRQNTDFVTLMEVPSWNSGDKETRFGFLYTTEQLFNSALKECDSRIHQTHLHVRLCDRVGTRNTPTGEFVETGGNCKSVFNYKENRVDSPIVVRLPRTDMETIRECRKCNNLQIGSKIC
jgi:hypothetical protein